MDWMLVNSIPKPRIGFNSSGSALNYMEGSLSSQKSEHWNASKYINKDDFHELMDSTAYTWQGESFQADLLSRIHGRGSETGIADGFLHPQYSLLWDGKTTTRAWPFYPRARYGLGNRGDSGTWIFTEDGKVLGMITSYNHMAHMTYYTPIHVVFEHIKQVSGATEVRLPTKNDYLSLATAVQDDSGYESSSPLRALAASPHVGHSLNE